MSRALVVTLMVVAACGPDKGKPKPTDMGFVVDLPPKISIDFAGFPDYPSHISSMPLPPSRPGVTTGIRVIDTGNMTISFTDTKPAPDASFQIVGPFAVLTLDALTVSTPISARGTLPLIIVVQGDVTIEKTGGIDASARGDTAGPGGYDPAMGPGAGATGTDSAGDDAGGGGGSYGVQPGGVGGTVGTKLGGAAGTPYGSASELVGGSGGAAGGLPKTESFCIQGGGGAGGGAIQISSISRIVIEGFINVGGGGGLGGCVDGLSPGAGGGGGAGGMVFLEAPMLQVLSTANLASLGGGGGSGADGELEGEDGDDGDFPNAALGGVMVGARGWPGGIGCTATISGFMGGGGPGGDGGGGGGGSGRIYFRSHDLMIDPAALVAPKYESAGTL